MGRPVVIAHRGVPGERLEHTRASFVRAIELGADYLEPDVVCTADGHLVVRHENEIGQTTDVAQPPSSPTGTRPGSSTVCRGRAGSRRTSRWRS